MQRELELIAEALRIPGSKSLGPVARVRDATAKATLAGIMPLEGLSLAAESMYDMIVSCLVRVSLTAKPSPDRRDAAQGL